MMVEALKNRYVVAVPLANQLLQIMMSNVIALIAYLMEFQSNYGLQFTIVASTFFWIGRFIILLNFIVF
ncbi:hypothetical protein HanLR1_Chr12g0433061 [Helianthus annuus]|nr:hypothetical protein HanLR1_Chr12g0433061 [Helianthus annuus]